MYAQLRSGARPDRDDVPPAARPGQGDRRLRLRRVSGRLDRPARRRRADPGGQLALDLLHQRPDRHRDGAAGDQAGRRSPGARPPAGRRRRGRRTADRRPDARRLHDPPGRRPRLGLNADPRARWALRGAARGIRRPAGPRPHPAGAAAAVPLARGLRGERRPGAARRRDVRHVLPGRALPTGDPRLRRARGRSRVPAGDARDGHRLLAPLGAAGRSRPCSPA
jgi:hypothetical protein